MIIYELGARHFEINNLFSIMISDTCLSLFKGNS